MTPATLLIDSLGDRLDPVLKNMGDRLAPGITLDSVLAGILSCMRRDPDVLRCSADSIVTSVERAVSFGLEPGESRGDEARLLVVAAPAPDQACTARCIVTARGILSILRQTPEIHDVIGRIAREGEQVELDLGANIVRHIASTISSTASAQLYYAHATLREGQRRLEVITTEQAVTFARTSMSSGEARMWEQDPDGMALRLVLLNLCKSLPKTAERAWRLVQYEYENAGANTGAASHDNLAAKAALSTARHEPSSTSDANAKSSRITGDETLQQIVPRLLKMRLKIGQRSVADAVARANKHILSHEIATIPVRQIDWRRVDAWYRELLEKPAQHRYRGKRLPDATISPATAKNALYLLSGFFTTLIDLRALDSNPCKDIAVRNPRETKERWIHLSAQEVKLVRGAFEARCATEAEIRALAAFLLLVGTGVSEGELRALKRGCIKLTENGGTLEVREGKPNYPTRTELAKRTIPLFPLAREAIDVWSKTGVRVDVEPDRYLFESENGGPFFKGALLPRRLLRRATREAGLERAFRLQDCRHTFAALLLAGELDGTPSTLDTLSAYLGYASIARAERYAHLRPSGR